MKLLIIALSLAGIVVSTSLHPFNDSSASETQVSTAANNATDAAAEARGAVPQSTDEARTRARLLHETINGALQVMHRDFFDEDETRKIPSRSLEDVFVELARSHKVQVRWLAVNAEPMSIDHKPNDEFEKQAVRAIASGASEFESVSAAEYRFVGRIVLSSQCLKCHLPRRTSTEDRAAGLLIAMPFKDAK